MPVAVEDPYDTYRTNFPREEHVGKLTLKADKQVTCLEKERSLNCTKQSQTIENLLPDEEDLFSGVLDVLGCTAVANSDDEDSDLFSNNGGIELEGNTKVSISHWKPLVTEGFDSDQSSPDLFVSCEHPSRTLLVENVDKRVEDYPRQATSLMQQIPIGTMQDQLWSFQNPNGNSFPQVATSCMKDEYIYGAHSLLQPICSFTSGFSSTLGMSPAFNQFGPMPYYSTDQAFHPQSLPISCKDIITYESLNSEAVEFTTEAYDKHLHMLSPYGSPTGPMFWGSSRMPRSAVGGHYHALSCSNSLQNPVIWSNSPPSNDNICAHTTSNFMKCSLSKPKGRVRRISHRRYGHKSCHTDDKKFELDIESVLRGEDSRTTLMIKNIPNRYSSDMLLAAINEHNQGTYDFIYLPLDFKNKCNMGYAFINMTDPLQIVPFHKAIDGKKWEKFHSGKVACLTYARIQGKAALIANFQESSLMNQDKCCHPILFTTDGPNAGNQEPFPLGTNIHSRRHKNRCSTYKGNENQETSSTP